MVVGIPHARFVPTEARKYNQNPLELEFQVVVNYVGEFKKFRIVLCLPDVSHSMCTQEIMYTHTEKM